MWTPVASIQRCAQSRDGDGMRASKLASCIRAGEPLLGVQGIQLLLDRS
jgi:hypothetical protein